MKLMRNAALLGMAKKLYDEARKPHNQAKIQKAVNQVRSRGSKRGPAAPR